MARPLIVGEDNPYGGDPEMALYPSPDGCSGWRLCHLVLGMTRASYLAAFDRANLCQWAWDLDEARIKSHCLRRWTDKLILCGARVCQAFGVPYEPLRIRVLSLSPHSTGLIVPHPSGRCRAWNDPETVPLTRLAVAAYLPELAEIIGEAK